MTHPSVRSHRVFLLAAAMVAVPLFGCHTCPRRRPPAASDASSVPAAPWPEEQALAVLSSLLAERSPTIVDATGLMCFDCGGVGLSFSSSQAKDTGVIAVIVSCPFGQTPPGQNSIWLQDEGRSEKSRSLRWGQCPVPVGSPLEARLVELARRVAESSPEPVARYNAKELLAVLNDRTYGCRWRRFWYGHEGYGEGYGARYRAKYGDD